MANLNAQHRKQEDFWYGIPGVQYGAAVGHANSLECYAIIDVEQRRA